MASFDKESDIFESIQLVSKSKIWLVSESDTEEIICDALHSVNNWHDNSNDTNRPPDYIDEKDNLMMDFMRTNDYEKRKKSGKVVNTVAAEENRMMRELQESGILDALPDLENVFTIPSIDYDMKPSLTRYYENTKAILVSHSKQIDKYKSNYPGKQLIFCICDLSEYNHLMRMEGESKSFIYHPCFDKRFMKLIKECKADYVVWFSPYIEPYVDSPRLVIIDVAKLDTERFLDILDEPQQKEKNNADN